MVGIRWQYLQLTPEAQHPLAKKRQKQAPLFQLNRSAAVYPTSSSGSQRVRAASFYFSSLAQMYLLYQKLYSSSPSLQVQLLAKLVSTCFLAGLSLVSVNFKYFSCQFLANSFGIYRWRLSLGSPLGARVPKQACTRKCSYLGSYHTDSPVSELKQQFFLFSSSQYI